MTGRTSYLHERTRFQKAELLMPCGLLRNESSRDTRVPRTVVWLWVCIQGVRDYALCSHRLCSSVMTMAAAPHKQYQHLAYRRTP